MHNIAFESHCKFLLPSTESPDITSNSCHFDQPQT